MALCIALTTFSGCNLVTVDSRKDMQQVVAEISIGNGAPTEKYLIAVDSVGAGIGETVLITEGSPARLALHNQNSPVDAVIVGIVD